MAEQKAPRKLCIIASKGSLDMAYPPMILANAARMSGIETHMFFTFWGLDIITKKKRQGLECCRCWQSQYASLVPHPDYHRCDPVHVRRSHLDDEPRDRQAGFPPSGRVHGNAGGCRHAYLRMQNVDGHDEAEEGRPDRRSGSTRRDGIHGYRRRRSDHLRLIP